MFTLTSSHRNKRTAQITIGIKLTVLSLLTLIAGGFSASSYASPDSPMQKIQSTLREVETLIRNEIIAFNTGDYDKAMRLVSKNSRPFLLRGGRAIFKDNTRQMLARVGPGRAIRICSFNIDLDRGVGEVIEEVKHAKLPNAGWRNYRVVQDPGSSVWKFDGMQEYHFEPCG